VAGKYFVLAGFAVLLNWMALANRDFKRVNITPESGHLSPLSHRIAW
jgi:hypothetical protein